MTEAPHEPSAEKPFHDAADTRPAMEEVRLYSSSGQHADNFSLSALFLLMVTVAALLGFASNALPGRRIVEEQDSFIRSAKDAEPLTLIAAVVLTIIGIVEGGRAGYVIKRRFSTMIVGMFYGMISAAIPIAALIRPPSLLMVCFSCGMLIAVGLVLGSKAKRTMVIDELEATK
jgi:hypothetical protein